MVLLSKRKNRKVFDKANRPISEKISCKIGLQFEQSDTEVTFEKSIKQGYMLVRTLFAIFLSTIFKGAIQEKYGRDNVYIRTRKIVKGSNQKEAFSKKIVFLHLVREAQLTYNAALVAYTDATL